MNKVKEVIGKKLFYDSVCRSDESYYPQTLQEDCKYNVQDKKWKRFLTEDLTDSKSDMNLKNKYVWFFIRIICQSNWKQKSYRKIFSMLILKFLINEVLHFFFKRCIK